MKERLMYKFNIYIFQFKDSVIRYYYYLIEIIRENIIKKVKIIKNK